MNLQNTDELETATNTIEASNECELSDADLMAINGGGLGASVVDPLLTILGTVLLPVLPPVGPLVGGILLGLGTTDA